MDVEEPGSVDAVLEIDRRGRIAAAKSVSRRAGADSKVVSA
jgi:hypothetical protein